MKFQTTTLEGSQRVGCEPCRVREVQRARPQPAVSALNRRLIARTPSGCSIASLPNLDLPSLPASRVLMLPTLYPTHLGAMMAAIHLAPRLHTVPDDMTIT